MSPKPFVQAACVCEKVLRESDNVPTLVRLIDTYTVTSPPAGLFPEGLKTAVPLTIFVGLKSGEITGEHELGIRLMRPDGTPGATRKWPAIFGGRESGVNLQLQFALDSYQDGLYWFDVIWEDGEVLTRIPLRLIVKTAEASESPTEHEHAPAPPA